MKKFLSIKNTQGIYVARASISSDETVIDFVNNNSINNNTSDNSNSIPISIVLPTPKKHLRQQRQKQQSLSSLSEPKAGDSLQNIEFDRISSVEYIDPSDLISSPTKIPSKRKRFTKILQIFHIKGKKKIMNENPKEEPTNPKSYKNSNQNRSPVHLPSASTPKFQRNKGRTAALVKKFSMATKKPMPILSAKGKKKSAIPLRTAASVETISNGTQIVQRNYNVDKTMASTSISHHSMSEMNLVNIDYRQESGNIENDFNFEFDQMHFGDNNNQQHFEQPILNSNRRSDSLSGDGGIGNNLNRGWNTSSNLSIRSGISTLSNSQYGSVRNSTGSEKLQITISGKKSGGMESDPVTCKLKQPQQFNTIATNESERCQPTTKAVLQKQQQQQQQCESLQFPSQAKSQSQSQSQPEQSSLTKKKLNISHDLTLMNTVGTTIPITTTALTAITTQASIPSYRISCESIKNVVPSSTSITTQSTMQSQQANVNVDNNTLSNSTLVISEPSTDIVSGPSVHSSNEINLKLTQELTSFDGDEEIPVADIDEDTNNKSSLLTEIIEAEQQERSNNSMNLPERGRRYPGLAASETIKFTHSTTMAAIDDLNTNPNELSDAIAIISDNDDKTVNQFDIVPKVIVQDASSIKSDNSSGSGHVAKESNQAQKLNQDLIHSLTKSIGAKVLQVDTNNGATVTPTTPSTNINNNNNNNNNEIDSIPPSSSQQSSLQIERRNMSSSPEKREHLYKILVIGELGTGKTSFIKRYVHQYFSPNYRATIGVDFALKVLNWDQNTIIRLQLWDIAGQERFGNMTRVYYKEAVGAFIVFDVTRSATFDAVIKWKQDLDSKVQLPNGSPIPCILIANKCDQAKQGIVNTPSKMDDYVKEHGFAGWFETSAKLNINIEEAARALVNKILMNDKIINASEIFDAEKFNLDGSHSDRPKKNCSC